MPLVAAKSSASHLCQDGASATRPDGEPPEEAYGSSERPSSLEFQIKPGKRKDPI
jgi:hypothetical protein